MNFDAALRLLITLLVAVILPITATAGAQVVTSKRNLLVELRSRVFDLGADVRYMRQYENFIPISRVRWISALTGSDPYLRYSVIHIRTFSDFPGKSVKWVWLPDENREQYAPANDLADAWALHDYDVRWRHKFAPSTRGDIVLLPKAPNAGYYISCGYDRADRVPTFCAADALYPPDPDLRVMVRIYQVTNPLNDFEAIAKRALDLVHCLDVTGAVEAGSWKPLQVGQWKSLTEFLATCRNVSS